MLNQTEYFESIDLINSRTLKFPDESIMFRATDKEEPWVKFSLIEIKSSQPPTDCHFVLTYTSHSNNALKYFEFHSMTYRKEFIFENGYYNLYLNLKELPEDLIPYSIQFTNKRDLSSLGKLFYCVHLKNRQVKL